MAEMIAITLPDGSVKNYPEDASAYDVAAGISKGLARQVLSATWQDQTVEVMDPLPGSGRLVLHTWDSPEGKKAFWHSAAHLMAQTLEQMYPGIKLTIGPPIEKGFYYDVDLNGHQIGEADLPAIEKKMLENAREKAAFQLRPVSKSAALDYYRENKYKTELIENLEDGAITFCDHADFTDLCRGGHIPNTGFIKAVKILNIAGAYWRGDEKKDQLTRIYGIAFPKASMLDEYLEQLEQARQRDHRKLGRELELFTFSQKVGQGLPLWLPKGAALRERLEQFLKEAQRRAGYEPVISPHIGNKELYVTSGHYAKYGEDSFQPIHTPEEGEEYLLKPMNCPHHCEIYKSQPRSYRDLPVRFAEFGTVYRYEQSGELHGLTRVRGFTQDDAHLFCTPDQLQEEFMKVIDLVLYIFKTLDFQDFKAQVSLRDPDDKEKYIGSDANWDKAEEAIKKAVSHKDLPYTIEYGEAAFYGPKLDFMVRDALDREWQLGTIQVDYNLPERFELEYKGEDNAMHRPVMIHRAPFGSMERFVAVLLEHCGGNFPLWLTPEQVAILPISEKYSDYAERVSQLLKNYDLRALIDERAEKTSRKIRDAEVSKIPYMVIVGEKEAGEDQVSVRRHGGEDLGTMKIEEFANRLQEEVKAEVAAF